MPMDEKITRIIEEKVNPLLAAHYGGTEATALEDGILYVRMMGACGQCPSAQDTIENIVKDIIMAEIPEVKDVVLDTSVSEDLINMARKILKKEL